jgi:hypothetical protein
LFEAGLKLEVAASDCQVLYLPLIPVDIKVCMGQMHVHKCVLQTTIEIFSRDGIGFAMIADGVQYKKTPG